MGHGAGGNCKVRHLELKIQDFSFHAQLLEGWRTSYQDNTPIPATPNFRSRQPRKDVRYGDGGIDGDGGSRGPGSYPPC